MAEAQIYINDAYSVSSSTNTVVQYVELTIEAAKSDIIQDIRPEIDSLVDESLSAKMGMYSLTNHSHDSYATKDDLSHYSLSNHLHESYALASEVYNKQEVDLKILTFTPDLTDYPTKDELQQQLSNYSTISHTHDYALSSDTYNKQEVNDIVNSHTPDLSDYFTKSETEDLVNSYVPDLSDYYSKSLTDNLISGFKNITFLTTDEYNNLDPKDENVLYILTDSEEEAPDLSQYVTIEQLNARGYKTILYISTSDYEALDPKEENVLYILTDSEEQTIDLTDYYTKSETDNLISGFKKIEYLTTEAYESLENKDENVLYILTDNQEEEIDLSSYVTRDELNAKGFKSIQYITTSEYEALDPKSPDVLYILTDSEEPTIDLSSYALNSSLSEHINDASAHFTSEEREAYDAFAGEFYQDDAWNILPKSAFDDTMSDMSTAMGQFDTRIANNDSSISAIKSRLNEFSLSSHTHADYVLNASLSDNYYNKTQTDEKLDEKANICVLDIYAIGNGDVTVTEEMWNEWIECILNGGVFIQDNGNLRITLQVFGGVDENGDKRSSIGFIIVDTLGYSYNLYITKEDDGRNISFVVDSPVEDYIVYNINDINEWDDSKWNYVTNHLIDSIFKYEGELLYINNFTGTQITITTVGSADKTVYTVTREEDREGNATFTVVENNQYEIEVIDDLSTWNDEKWNLVSKNSNGAKLFTHNGNPLNVSENKKGQLLLSYLENGTALRVVTVTKVATRSATGYTYTVEINNFYIDDIENKQDKLNLYSENGNSATIAINSEEGSELTQENNVTVDLSGIYVNLDSSASDYKMTSSISVGAETGFGIYNDAEYTEDNPDYGATTAHSWLEVYNESITMDVSLGNNNNIFKIDPSAVTINDDRVLTETDLDDFYTKSYIDTSLNNVYTKSYIDTSLNNVYTKSEIDTTLAGYSLTSHTHNEYALNSALNDYYNKSYIDTSLNDVYTKSQVYTKTEIDTMIGDIETVLATI